VWTGLICLRIRTSGGLLWTNSNEQSPWEANSHSPNQEISRILCSPKVHYCVHKSPAWYLSWGRCNQSTNFHLIFVRSIPILASSLCLCLPRSLCFSRISHPSHLCYMFYHSHPPWLDHLNSTWWSLKVTKLPIMQFFQVSCHFLLLGSKYSPQHPLLKAMLQT